MGLSSKREVFDGDYLLGRAEAEILLAEQASSERAAAMHQKLASAYFDRLFADGAVPALQLDRLEALREKRVALASLFQWPRNLAEQEHPILSELLQTLDATND
jgi:hypothetical protein